MTLILSVLTDDYVVQASDRRLTSAQTGKVVDDDANKAVVFNGHLAVGYTGLSQIGGRSTDIWITDVLRKYANPIDALDGLCREGARDLPRVPSAWQRHAFVLVGWTRVNDLIDLQPCAFIVSNFFDPAEGKWLTAPNKEFTWVTRLPSLAGETPMVISVPQFAAKPMAKLERSVRDAVTRGLGPTALGRLLVDRIRQVAETERTVGSDVMVCSIPRQAAEAADLSWSATPAGEPLSRTQIGSYYSTADQTVLIGAPNFVTWGAAVTARTRITAGATQTLTPEYLAQIAKEFGVNQHRRR